MKLFEDVLETVSAKSRAAFTPFVIAIDGRCGSGKSTLAEFLAGRLQAPLLHMDDFYLPFAQRTPKRLEQVGGHIDEARFYQEVLMPVCQGKEIIYRAYRPHTDTWLREEKINPHPMYIVEGSYCQLPKLAEFYQYKIFLTSDSATQRKRLLLREGAEKTEQFLARWIPAEERYFAACKVPERADLRLDTSDGW